MGLKIAAPTVHNFLFFDDRTHEITVRLSYRAKGEPGIWRGTLSRLIIEVSQTDIDLAPEHQALFSKLNV